ncbi:hypothetical protein AB1L42_03460 [Thalassoglobus sp. JC818]|uniref:hypothetical protein n=1 Tax=Thalassoglobus sp. JC818 TaxID=3232136 RepID=UPI00345A3D25
MRIQPWIKAVASALMLATVQTETSGQSPVPPGPAPPPGAYVAPGQGGGPMMPHYPPHLATDPTAIYPQNAPQGFQPWPAISPFYPPNVGMDQHVSQDGLWFRNIFYRQRKYFGSVELMSVQFRDAGDALIGSPFAPLANFDIQRPIGVPIDTIYEYPSVPNLSPDVEGYFAVSRRIFLAPALDTNANVFNGQINGYFYPPRNSGDIDSPTSTLGTQIRWGYENEDGTGLMANGWWAFEDTGSFKKGATHINGVPVSQDLTLILDGQNLLIHGVVPLYNGEPVFPDFGLGTSAKFDVLFEVEQKTEAGGTNLSFYTQPVYNRGGVKIRPMVGARYTYLKEQFRFHGIDSGFTYTLDEDTHRPETNSIVRLYDQYDARLENGVTSHIAGPEAGFRIDLGDDDASFKAWAETILGVNANHESIDMSGDNIGDPLFDARFVNILDPRMLNPANQSKFSDEKSSTHVSPFFQQSVMAEFAAFRSLPLIRNISALEHSSFRFGYTFTWIGAVARPADSIEWRGFPLYPKIDTDREEWYMHQLNFGLDCSF